MQSGIDIAIKDRLNIEFFNLTDFKETYLLIQINFTNPDLIS